MRNGTSLCCLFKHILNKHPTTVTRQNRLAHGAKMGPASHLAFYKSSIIGGLGVEDEVGSAARERPQMKSVNGMYIITSSTNHQRSQLPVDVSIIANHLHPYM